MIILITGGIKSGKSDFALKRAERAGSNKKLYFIATALPMDSEIQERIKIHKKKRNPLWNTIEEPEDLKSALSPVPETSIVLIDCLTLWLGNLLSKPGGEKTKFTLIEKKVKNVLAIIEKKKITAVFVSNEVGSGIIPDNKLSRIYGEFLGKINQIIAQSAQEVYLMVSGLSIKIKGARK